MTTTLRHDPSMTRIETSWQKQSDGITVETIDVAIRGTLGVRVDAFDGGQLGPWRSTALHLRLSDTPDDEGPTAKVKSHAGSGLPEERYVVVRLSLHESLFVPIEIAEAIAAAIGSEAVAS